MGYDQFQECPKLWRNDPLTANTAGGLGDTDVPVEEQSFLSAPSFDGFFSSFPDELGEFTAIPGINDDMPLDQDWLNTSHPERITWNFSDNYDLAGH